MINNPFLFLTSLCFGPGALEAHEIPIHPVEIELRVYPDLIRATMNSNQCYWSAEILRVSLPPPAWTETLLGQVKKYVDEHFPLTVDGKPLESRILEARYVQEPWQDVLSGRVIFRFLYRLPPQKGRWLSGRATFFSEHAREDPDENYVTYLDVPGRRHMRWVLPLKAPGFELPIDEATRTPWQAAWDRLWSHAQEKGHDIWTMLLGVLFICIVVRY